MKQAKSFWHSQVGTQTQAHILEYNPLPFYLAFNEMDENHDGQVSEDEFIEVGLVYNLFYCFNISLGLHESEKVFNDADIKNHRCFRDFRMTSSLRVSAHIIFQRDNMMKGIVLLK